MDQRSEGGFSFFPFFSFFFVVFFVFFPSPLPRFFSILFILFVSFFPFFSVCNGLSNIPRCSLSVSHLIVRGPLPAGAA
jgi:hypothetical protein